MDRDLQVKLAVYGHFAETGRHPSLDAMADRIGLTVPNVLDAYRHLRAQRVLVLESDGASIRMAPPFSGVVTQHVVAAGGVSYFANCAWDALGIPAALGPGKCGRSSLASDWWATSGTQNPMSLVRGSRTRAARSRPGTWPPPASRRSWATAWVTRSPAHWRPGSAGIVRPST
jgi:hypothetical protein